MKNSKSRYLLVGDVHACYYTMLEMLEKHWNPEDTTLIMLGDVVFKGKNSIAVLNHLYQLSLNPELSIIFLKGNNEAMMLDQLENLPQIQNIEGQKLIDSDKQMKWVGQWRHFFEEKNFYASHAGVGEDANFPLNQDDLSLIYQRNVLKNINKTQYIGHIVVDKPQYIEASDAWYLDTGAGDGEVLTAVLLNENQKIETFFSVKVDDRDKVEK